MTTQTITLPESILSTEFLRLVRFRDIQNGWSVFSGRGRDYSDTFPLISLGDVMKRSKNVAIIQDGIKYRRLTIKLYTKGVGIRDEADGKDIGTKNQWFVKAGQFIISKIDARNGAFGIVPTDCDGAIATNDFPAFDVDNSKMLTEFLQLISGTEHFRLFCENASTGTTGRRRVDIGKFLDAQIPLPDIETQARIVKSYHDRVNEANSLATSMEEKAKGIEAYLVDAFGLTIRENITNKGFEKIRFKDLEDWSPDSIFGEYRIQSEKFDVVSFSKKPEYCLDAFRGKSPTYKDGTKSFILNQKCNRWDDIELEHTKTVDDEWFAKVNKNLLTKKGDLIINSTGEGTLGRCSLVYEDYEGLLCDSHMLVLRVNPEKVDARFLVKQFNAGFFQKQIDAIKSARATKQTELGVENLLNLSFVIPPLPVQSEIIEHIEGTKAEISKAKDRQEELRESAKKEFEAELFGIS